MVNTREGLGLLVKFVRAALTSTEEDTTEEPETETTEALEVDTETEPTMVYWETDRNKHFRDLFLEKGGLNRIPDTTEDPVKEFNYKFFKYYSNSPEAEKNTQAANIFSLNGVQETPKAGTGISSSGRDASVVAGIVVAVISGILILVGLIAVVVYKHYVHRNVTSMNFDNPVYRKTTEDQFALEKNGYAPGSKLYPSTVGEEAREPLNTPGTNEFV